MLNLTELIGFAAGGRPYVRTVGRGSAYYSAGNASAYSYAASYGGLVESPSRLVVVGYSAAAGPTSAVSCTVGGLPATKVAEYAGSGLLLGFFVAVVPTGASGNVIISFNGTATGCTMFTWGVNGVETATGLAGVNWGTSLDLDPSEAPGLYFWALLGTDSTYSIGGASVTNADGTTSAVSAAYGPVQESTSYFHAFADFFPNEYGGVAQTVISKAVMQVGLVLW